MQRLLLLGLNHATAPLPVREKLAFTPKQRGEALEQFRQRFPEAEAVLLSTCNRVELYAARPVHGHPRPEEMTEFLGQIRQIAPEQFASHLYQKSNIEVVQHLFTVASSLDSMVVGETQILGQVREAYDAAREAQTCGTVLHPLFQRAVAVGKQVLAETAIAEGRLSVASVAVDYARRIFEDFADKTVLSIGAGKMAGLVLRHFSELRPGRLLICNRDQAKAAALVQQFGGEAVTFEALADHLVAADVVISSTAAPHPIITREKFEPLLKKRRYRPIFLIDIALPRDVEAQVGELENVYLYNIDDLQQVVASTRQQRSEEVASATKLIVRQVEDFVRWQRAREVGPVIEQLYRRYHQLAQEELTRTLAKLPNLSGEEKNHLEDLTRRVVNKLLHHPVKALRSTESLHGPAMQYLRAVEELLRDQDDEEDDDTPRTS